MVSTQLAQTHGPQKGPKWAANWGPSGQTMWAPLGICSRDPQGSHMGFTWAPLEPHLGPTWDSPGIQMGPTWDLHGPHLGPICTRAHLGPTWDPNGPHQGNPHTDLLINKFRYVFTTYSNRLETLLTTYNKVVRMVVPLYFIITSLLNGFRL